MTNQCQDRNFKIKFQGVAGPDKDGGATGHPTSIPSPGSNPQNSTCFRLSKRFSSKHLVFLLEFTENLLLVNLIAILIAKNLILEAIFRKPETPPPPPPLHPSLSDQ